MSETLAHVTFRKQVSDGNYGSETAEVSFEMSRADDAEELLQIARQIVHDELARSPSSSVRRALEVPKPIDDDEDPL